MLRDSHAWRNLSRDLRTFTTLGRKVASEHPHPACTLRPSNGRRLADIPVHFYAIRMSLCYFGDISFVRLTHSTLSQFGLAVTR